MYKNLKRAAGIILVLVGILGLFLPILQGFLFIGVGIYLIESETLNRWLRKHIKRWEKERKEKRTEKKKRRGKKNR
ncbi:MAG: hypothetical protein R6U32_05780 [Candidatus Woesearchaeota archaeon]